PRPDVLCDPPWGATLMYAAPETVGPPTPLPPKELVEKFRVLGANNRLRMLWLIGQCPRSTQELAPLVNMTEAGLSRPLRALEEAGLLQSRREGYYVLYSLVPGAVERLSSTLLSFLFGDEGKE